MERLGPFVADLMIDDEKNVYVQITHIWDSENPYTIPTSINISDGGTDAIPLDLVKRTLISWLIAGDRSLIEDLLYIMAHDCILEKTVKAGNASSGRVNLPKTWEGETVLVVKVTPYQREEE